MASGGGAGAETTNKALRATANNGDVASVPPLQQLLQPAPLPAAGVAGGAADGSVSAAARRQSCGEDDQDDEQVERFYALLANIRALRGLYSAGTGPASSGRGGRKRARGAEAPWTPAFRLEDFEEEVNQGGAADARCDKRGASGGEARRPAAADDDGHDEGDGVAEVARRGGDKLGRRRVSTRG